MSIHPKFRPDPLRFPKFARAPRDVALIHKIAKRACDTMQGLAGLQLDVAMDISATHANGCRLDLERLFAADGFNFAHDILGIRRHLDRDTGRLGDCFLPRFHVAGAKRHAHAVALPAGKRRPRRTAA